MKEIRVKVVALCDRAHFMLNYRCPDTGKRKYKSSGVERSDRKRDRDAAERAAAVWESEVRAGTYKPACKTGWDEFRHRYEDERLPALSKNTGIVLNSVFNLVEAILAPTKLTELTTERLSRFQAELRAGGRSEATIRTYSAHLGAALKWAAELGLLNVAPKLAKPPRAKGGKVMKGRPIALEEFERMLSAVDRGLLDFARSKREVTRKRRNDKRAVKPTKRITRLKPATATDEAAIAAWQFYLKGLWASGLRLTESQALTWDRQDGLRVDLSGRRPMLRIPAALEKGNQDRVLPMAPEFAELLLSVPEAQRRGRVFKLTDRRGNPRHFRPDHVGRVVSAIGKAAGVVVSRADRGDREASKFASAHDLRRSFGERWATRVMPVVLQELMRHESIETTLKFYVGQNAERTADVLWAAHESVHSIGYSALNSTGGAQ